MLHWGIKLHPKKIKTAKDEYYLKADIHRMEKNETHTGYLIIGIYNKSINILIYFL